METLLTDTVILLFTATLLVALLHRLGISSILAFLITGMILGSHGLELLHQSDGFKLLAELGVVFLMFLVGLEFSLTKILSLRKAVFLGGGLQVIGCTLFGFAFLQLFDLSLWQSLLGGVALAMSSTALVLQSLSEKHDLHKKYGQQSIAILLFQDIATIPLLVIVTTVGANNQVDLYQFFISLGRAFGLFLGMYIVGKYLLTKVITQVINTHSRELKLLTILSITLGSAALADHAGASMPIGAFLAGLIIGETEFKSEIEKDVLPFRDILLGLFFVTLGTQFNMEIIPENILLILGLISLLTVIKLILVTGILNILSKDLKASLSAGFALAQGGEFGLLILSYAQKNAFMDDVFTQCMIISIITTMALTPMTIRYSEKLSHKLLKILHVHP